MRTIIMGAMMVCMLSAVAQAQNYRVQIATYEKSVGLDYFKQAGITEPVVQETDINLLYRYYLKARYVAQSEAIAAQEEIIDKGFEYARVIDIKEEAAQCAKTPCGKYTPESFNWDGFTPPDDGLNTPTTTPAGVTPRGGFTTEGGLVVGIIFFDFDKSFLRMKSKQELATLRQILARNPDYNVILVAHTDSKGTDNYNVGLAGRRGTSAKKFLLANGIDASRIKIQVKGESHPIAKNATGSGKDLPEGRQLNRRVEFVLVDGNGQPMPELVREVDIPDYLRLGFSSTSSSSSNNANPETTTKSSGFGTSPDAPKKY